MKLKRMLAILGLLPLTASAAAFVDNFDRLNSSFWYAGDGWKNGAPFNVGWRADHAVTSGGQLALTIDNASCPNGCSGMPYASANVASNARYGYGTVYGRLQAAAGAGLVSSLFTYVGPDSGHAHDEIDIEILGQDTTKVQFNFFTNGSTGNEHTVNLGFDASQGLHDYAFTWTPSSISWYVDGVLRYTVNSNLTALPNTPGQVMMNLWAVDSSATGWAGSYNGAPASAYYDYVGYTPYVPTPEPNSLLLLAAALPWLGRRTKPSSASRKA